MVLKGLMQPSTANAGLHGTSKSSGPVQIVFIVVFIISALGPHLVASSHTTGSGIRYGIFSTREGRGTSIY